MDDGGRLVTVFTDASFDHKTKAGGYAVWIKASWGRLQHWGRLRMKADTSQVAEAAALVNGICLAARKMDMRPGDTIVAVSDCKNAIDMLRHGQGWSKQKRALVEMVRSETRARGINVVFRHVKAHTGGTDARSWVNDWCDKRAREGRKMPAKVAA